MGHAAEKTVEAAAGQVSRLLAEAQNLINSGAFEAAEAALAECLRIAPNAAAVHHRMGVALLGQGDVPTAYEHFKVAAAALPDDVDVWFQFALCLEKLRTIDAALIALQKAMTIGPATVEMYMTLGRLQHDAGNSDAAIEAFEAALVMRPGNFDAAYQRANEMQMKGDFAAAREAYLEALELQPDLMEVHFRLAEMGEVLGKEDGIVDGLLRAANEDTATTHRRGTAYFGAARIRRGQGRHDEAFEYYATANASFRAEAAFDRDAFDDAIERRIDSFTGAALAAHRGRGLSSRQPVFIVGMPRSGSTLTEQILSSHADVGAVGEFKALHDLDRALVEGGEDAKYVYPDDIAEMPTEALLPVGQSYLDAIHKQAGGGHARITDKFLFNFFNLGLIAILFPNATIIHCRRDARDIALSCYFQNFSSTGGLAFTYDLGDIGYYIRRQRELMDHWREVLPIPIHEVRYEELVADQERASRALIAHAGLDWDEACLRPHENTRSVRTASFWQVRQPVYSSSAGVWRDYERHLGPLLDELGDADF